MPTIDKKIGPPGPVEIDPGTGILKKQGSTVYQGKVAQENLGLETVARHIAVCEGHDPDNAGVITGIIARITRGGQRPTIEELSHGLR